MPSKAATKRKQSFKQAIETKKKQHQQWAIKTKTVDCNPLTKVKSLILKY